MAEHARQFSPKRADAIVEQKQTDLLAAIDLYEIGNIIPKRERDEFLRNEFHTEPQQVPEICRDLARIDAAAWFTTNYDSNLRHALRDRVLDALTNSDEDLRAAISLLGSQRLLVHLHGRAAVPELMVLGSRSYARLTSREAYEQLLRDTFLNYSVVAIGFSFTDPPFIQLLQYIGEHLGGAGRQTHVAILPQDTAADKNLLQSANFELVLYDSSKGHEYAGECVRHLARPVEQSELVVATGILPDQGRIDGLVRILVSLTSKHRNQTFDMAAGAIVVNEIQDRPLRSDVLAKKVSRNYGLSSDLAQKLIERGVAALHSADALESPEEPLKLKRESIPPSPPYPEITKTIKSRLLSIDRTVGRSGKVHTAAIDVIRKVMIVQGMTAARSFLNEDRPDAYLLSQVVDAAIALTPNPSASTAVIKQAVIELLRDPSPEISRELFYLANAAFALETIFLNPTDSNVGATLNWRIYLDSNVAMRALHPACDASGGITKLLSRLKQLRVPMFMLGPISSEIFTHVEMIGREIAAFGPSARIAEYLERSPAREHSPILRWYSWGVESGRWRSYQEFRKTSELVTWTQLQLQLTRLGIDVEGEDAVRRLDTGERETLWDALRKWRREDQFSQGARRLRRAEATQVMWIAQLREAGVRAWFLSQDGQLRRALKFIDRGKYAGVVATPTAWMLRLNQVHWAEVDVAGFSELMWAVPLTSPVERLRKLVVAEVLERSPDLAGKHPEWLRDQIEGLFTDVESLVDADLDSDADETSAILQWSQQLVPKTVEDILDRLAEEAETSPQRTRLTPTAPPRGEGTALAGKTSKSAKRSSMRKRRR
ncbi:SIR2 family NAD-dependent protein deacylase [Polyangium sorediatum]|uniref:SIR2 family protein n=1 Tax=Polyangium sorediatum TaxID=889274 RepID=A0ABT6PAP7_9BACT|nr:SIR2 family protein [Polyangium sorediatum]MDI1437648.1 SIR2 family protein [Polyangium sorediatum]